MRSALERGRDDAAARAHEGHRVLDGKPCAGHLSPAGGHFRGTAAVVLTWIAAATLLAWLVLMFARGSFWRTRPAAVPSAPEPEVWPHVVAVVPARNEAVAIGATLKSLRAQDYPGILSIIVVDDCSSDGWHSRRRAGRCWRHGPLHPDPWTAAAAGMDRKAFGCSRGPCTRKFTRRRPGGSGSPMPTSFTPPTCCAGS